VLDRFNKLALIGLGSGSKRREQGGNLHKAGKDALLVGSIHPERMRIAA